MGMELKMSFSFHRIEDLISFYVFSEVTVPFISSHSYCLNKEKSWSGKRVINNVIVFIAMYIKLLS